MSSDRLPVLTKAEALNLILETADLYYIEHSFFPHKLLLGAEVARAMLGSAATAFIALRPSDPATVAVLFRDDTQMPIDVVPVPVTKMDLYYEVNGKPTVRIIDIGQAADTLTVEYLASGQIARLPSLDVIDLINSGRWKEAAPKAAR